MRRWVCNCVIAGLCVMACVCVWVCVVWYEYVHQCERVCMCEMRVSVYVYECEYEWMCMFVLNTCGWEEESGRERLTLKRMGREDVQHKKASASLKGLRKITWLSRDKSYTQREQKMAKTSRWEGTEYTQNGKKTSDCSLLLREKDMYEGRMGPSCVKRALYETSHKLCLHLLESHWKVFSGKVRHEMTLLACPHFKNNSIWNDVKKQRSETSLLPLLSREVLGGDLILLRF